MNKETQQINKQNSNKLIAMTAHDLRGIIVRIYGLNRLLEEKIQELPDMEAKKMSVLINSQCKQGIDLTAGLVSAYKSSTFSLTELLTKQIVTYRYLAENKDIELKSDIPHKDIYVETKPVDLIRVLDNLFDNSVKFTPRNGNIKITLTQTDNKPLYHSKTPALVSLKVFDHPFLRRPCKHND